jgi:FkbM family methyltransferase
MTLLKPLGKSRRTVIDAFLYGIVRPIWNLLPDMSGFTYTAVMGDNKVRFRPFVMHDVLFVIANANRNHEPLVQKIFQPKPGEVFVDVGAHIGLYTMRAAREVGSKGKVIAVEPDPQSYRILKENVALNHLDNVTVINAALCDACGQMTFYACTDPSLSGFELQSEARLREVRTVQVLTLDGLLESVGVDQVNWIKLDVEGAETKVLHGAKNLLERAKNLHIIVESNNDRAIQYLKVFGFKTRYLGEIYYFAEKVVS